jgi:hypothetical protein
MSEVAGTPGVSAKEIAAEIAHLRDIRTKKAELKKPVKELDEQETKTEASIIAMLESSNLKTLTAEAGRATIVLKGSWRIPQTPEEMNAFLEFVKARDPELYFNCVCFKSTDVQKFCEMIFEEDQKRGEDTVVPGVGPETYRKTLSFTKA